MSTTTLRWNHELLLQLTWHWENQLRPRLAGLTDEEYRWAPVERAWSLRPRGQAVSAMADGGGEEVLDFEYPQPDPAPLTTIAWQVAHLVVGIFGLRNAAYFGAEQVDYRTFVYPSTAADALAALDAGYERWVAGVSGLGEDGLTQHCREPGFEDSSMAGLVLHIHREVIHHGAMISSLRDWYAWRRQGR